MTARSEAAARRHLERHLRQQGHARAYSKRVATLLPIAEVRALLPVWRRLLAAAGRFPAASDGMAQPQTGG